MQGIVVAALLLGSPGAGDDGFCAKLRAMVEGAPHGFAGVPLGLTVSSVPGVDFYCGTRNSSSADDPVSGPHIDLECETASNALPLNADPKDTREVDAVADAVGKCLGSSAMTGDKWVFLTPHARIDVVSMLLVSTHRFGPATTSASTLLTLHARR